MKLSGIVSAVRRSGIVSERNLRGVFSATMIARGLAATKRPQGSKAEAPPNFPDYETMERVTAEPADYLQDAEIDTSAPAVVQQQRRSAIQRMRDRLRKLRATR